MINKKIRFELGVERLVTVVELVGLRNLNSWSGKKEVSFRWGLHDLISKQMDYLQNYAEEPEPDVFMSVAASTSGRINEEYLILLFLHTNRESGVLSGEVPEESTQFRSNLKGSIRLMLAKVSVMRVTIPLDLPTRSFIPLPRFIHTGNTIPLLTPSLVLFTQSSV